MRKHAPVVLLPFFAPILCSARGFAQSHTVPLSRTPASRRPDITIATWNMLRRTTSGGPYPELDTQLVNVRVGTTSYTDTAVSSGSDYHVVRVLRREGGRHLGCPSVDSTEVVAVIPISVPLLAVATTSLPPTIVGTSYSVTLNASGCVAPYTLPGTGGDGLAFSATGLAEYQPGWDILEDRTVTVARSDRAWPTAGDTVVRDFLLILGPVGKDKTCQEQQS